MTRAPHSNGPVYRPCPICEGDDSDTFLQKGPLHLVRCRRCSMVYANPVDPELASGQFYDRLGMSFYLSPDKREADYAAVRFERELRLVRRFCRSGEVLDVGCSTGGFLFQLKTRHPESYRVTGMDVASTALDYAESRGIEVIRGSFLEHNFGPRRFDVITFWAVIEHLVEPKRFLRQAATLLRAGGHCFILVPNLRSLAVRLLGRKYRYLMPDHVNYFTADTLKRFTAEEPALEFVTLGFCHFNPIVILQDLRGRDERVSEQERARLLKRTTAWKQQPLLGALKRVYGWVEAALASVHLADNVYLVLRKR